MYGVCELQSVVDGCGAGAGNNLCSIMTHFWRRHKLFITLSPSLSSSFNFNAAPDVITHIRAAHTCLFLLSLVHFAPHK